MTSVIDDIYDVYGTLEELEVFTEAVERWDICMIGQLPAYMQFCYQALLDVYSEIEEEMTKQGKSYRVDYAKQAMKYQVSLLRRGQVVSQETYTDNGGIYMPVALDISMAATSFVMGDEATKHSFDWLFSKPKIERASCVVARVMDDMFEQKRGHVASAVERCMKQFGATEEEAVNEFRKQDEDGYTRASIVLKELVASLLINPFEQKGGHVASGVECQVKHRGMSEKEVYELFTKEVVNAWKDINEEMLRPTEMPTTILMRPFNFARVMDSVTSLLIDPIPND
nr:(-)-germacrene D synthase-like [Ziziphus jujuba var. spinosa]